MINEQIEKANGEKIVLSGRKILLDVEYCEGETVLAKCLPLV